MSQFIISIYKLIFLRFVKEISYEKGRAVRCSPFANPLQCGQEWSSVRARSRCRHRKQRTLDKGSPAPRRFTPGGSLPWHTLETIVGAQSCNTPTPHTPQETEKPKPLYKLRPFIQRSKEKNN